MGWVNIEHQTPNIEMQRAYRRRDLLRWERLGIIYLIDAHFVVCSIATGSKIAEKQEIPQGGTVRVAPIATSLS